MKLNLDKSSPIPIGVQIREQIKMLIGSGIYKYGQKLPSISALAASLDVNKNTIVTVLKDLESMGYIKCQRGKGAFVTREDPKTEANDEIISKIDAVMREAIRKNITLNEVLNIVSARYSYSRSHRAIKALFLMGISRELVELNLKRLRESISGVVFEGMLIGNETMRESLAEAFDNADFIIIPSMVYEYYKHLIPDHKYIIRTTPELKDLHSLKKGMEKKAKVAVIGSSRSGAQILGGMFVAERLFRPKMVLSGGEIEKYKKELKEFDSFVFCLSARESLEKIKLKDKNVFFFSNYISDDSIDNIKMVVKKIINS
jgi:GntR family transcriptional regulator